MASEAVTIPASRTKTLLLITGSIGFVALGLWFLSLDQEQIESMDRFDNPTLIYGVGAASVVFFGLCAGAGTWRMFSRKPGLTLDSEGVTIYAIARDTFVPWHDVSGLSTYEVHRQRMLVLRLKNPNKYIEMGGKLRTFMAKANYKLCGSPIAIPSSTLKLDFKELCRLFEEYFRRYGGGA